MATPVMRYAKSGDVHVAYQVFGSGSIDLVFAPGFISQIEHYWDHPDLARWLLRLGSFARVVIFDKRGTGLSDPVPEVPSLEQRMDDVRAVMDTVGIESAAQLGISEGVRWQLCLPQPTLSDVNGSCFMAPLLVRRSLQTR